MAEQFVDQSDKPIPPQDTWDTLSMNELIDVKTELENKLWNFQQVPQISLVLRRSIDSITKLIEANGNG